MCRPSPLQIKRKIKLALCILLFFCCPLLGAALSTSSLINESTLIKKGSSLINDSTLIKPSTLVEDTSLIASDSTLINETSLINIDGESYGIYQRSYQDTVQSSSVPSIYSNAYTSSIAQSRENTYAGNYDLFLEYTLDNDEASFIEYFSDWDKSNPNINFWEYAKNRSELEKLLADTYKQALIYFGAGAVVVAFPYTISIFGASIGSDVIVAKGLAWGNTAFKFAASFGASDAIASALIEYVANGYSERVWIEALSAGSEGFFTGAIIGTVTGAYRASKISDVFGNYRVLNNDLAYTKNGKKLGHVIRDSNSGEIVGILDASGNVVTSSGQIAGKLVRDSLGYPAAINQNGKIISFFGEELGDFLSDVSNTQNLFITSNGNILDFDGNLIGQVEEKGFLRFLSSNDSPIAYITSENIIIDKNVRLLYNATNPNSSYFWRALYFAEHPNVNRALVGDVHHKIERQILELFPGLFSNDEILKNPKNLAGIANTPEGTTAHLSHIRGIWDDCYARMNDYLRLLPATEQGSESTRITLRHMVEETRDYIDETIGKNFFVEMMEV